MPFAAPDWSIAPSFSRPDCASEEVLDLIESYADEREVWIEYGFLRSRTGSTGGKGTLRWF